MAKERKEILGPRWRDCDPHGVSFEREVDHADYVTFDKLKEDTRNGGVRDVRKRRAICRK